MVSYLTLVFALLYPFAYRHEIESEANASALGVALDLRAPYLRHDAVVRVVGVDIEEVFVFFSISVRERSRQLLFGELIPRRPAPPELIVAVKNLHPVARGILEVAIVFSSQRGRRHCKIRLRLRIR